MAGNIKLEFFTLVQNFLALTAGTQANATIQIPADANFILTHLHYQADIAAAGQTDSTRVVPLVCASISNGYTGRNLTNVTQPQNNIPLPALFGGQFPFALPKPLFLAANATLGLGVFNYDAANTYNLRLSLIGYKQFDVQA